MANTYSQIYIQIIFSVKLWENLIMEKHRVELEKYITGIVKKRNSKLLAIYCNPDHSHILIGLDPNISVSEIARDIKANSSKWINNKKWFNGKFKWQEGFGAFSYSKAQIDAVINYIFNQPEHHKRKSFREEYLQLLKQSDINYHDEYLFEWFDG